MSKETTVVIVLVVYKITLILIGLWAQRRTHSNTDFFVGGRALGPFVASISYAASSASAWSILSLSAAAFTFGLSTIWMFVGLILGHGGSWLWLAPRLQRLAAAEKLVTLTDVLALDGTERTKRAIRLFAAAVVTFCFVFYVATQFMGAGKAFASTFDMSMSTSILLGGGIVLIYTLLGGFWAVSVTDTLQGMLMLVAALLLPALALIEVGGPIGLWQGLQAISSPEQLSLTGPNVGLMALGFVVGTMAMGLGAFGQPHLLTRFMALKSQKAVRTAQKFAIFWFVVVLGNMVVLGLCGRILITQPLADPEQLFFVMTDSLLPTVLGAILLAAVLSAIMSTADSQLLVSASAVAHDVMGEPDEGENRLWVSRLVIAVLCGLSVAVAIYLPSDIFSRVMFAWGALGSAFGPVVLLRLAGVRLNPKMILPSMLIGLSLTILFYLQPNSIGDILERLVPFLICFILLYATKLNFTQKDTP
ncbi:sodium/proline symporter [Paremcibacter congregatus]|uniref:Sodium/proline symporter n=1 Tax=Paremcibacter congregatus TaxID=2043170 RepID=A0A2G4YLS4_9PROT|nr:sodium/proline symporter [Paremcibacter congregatus]PHZ83251.1 sodium:proline symporter [Paremcibacter congregatus]QDE28276.1 sodium/proline symporter [Paremcibacter congregatus]